MGSIRSNSRTTSEVGTIARARVDLWLVVALMAMSFGAGVIVKTMAEPPAVPASGFAQPGGANVLAPPLTGQQIGQGLPAGHPSVGSSASTAPTTGKGGGSGNGGGGSGG